MNTFQVAEAFTGTAEPDALRLGADWVLGVLEQLRTEQATSQGSG